MDFRHRLKDRGFWGAAVFILLLLVQIVLVYRYMRFGGSAVPVNYGFAIGIGLLVGATEMISRYPDDPFAPLISAPGAFYLLVNGGASALAYYLMVELRVPLDEPLRTLTAGIGAMAFFRSGLFTVRISGGDIAVGPNLIIQVLLNALDRTYDRQRAVPRSAAVTSIMGGISFGQVKEALPTLCFDLMQNVSDSEVSNLNTQIAALSASTTMTDDAKILSLGLQLFNIVGEGTLEAAVRALGNNIQGFTQVSQQMLVNLAKIDPKAVINMLPQVCAELPVPRKRDISLGTAPDFKVKIANLAPESEAVLVLYKLVDHYGDQRVSVALGILANQPPPAGGPGLLQRRMAQAQSPLQGGGAGAAAATVPPGEGVPPPAETPDENGGSPPASDTPPPSGDRDETPPDGGQAQPPA